MSVKEKVNTFFDKLPFKGMAEKIPAETRAKAPVLNKVIPFANQIVCGLVVVLLVTAIVACSGKSGGKSKGKEAPASDFKYELTADRKGIRITEYTHNAAFLVVPATIEDIPVVEIGDRVFSGKTSGEITLPASVTKIGKDVFSLMDYLTKVTLPEGLKEIPDNAFSASSSILTIDLPNSIEIIGESAFFGCNFSTIKLPNNIKKIGSAAFLRCRYLKTINLPDNLKEIGSGAFVECENLNNITIPDSLSSIKFSTVGTYYSSTNSNDAFKGLGKLPLKTRARLEDLGYKDGF